MSFFYLAFMINWSLISMYIGIFWVVLVCCNWICLGGWRDFFFFFGIDMDFLSCFGNRGISRVSVWEGDCLWESVWLCLVYGVFYYFLLCFLGGVGDEVRIGVLLVLNFDFWSRILLWFIIWWRGVIWGFWVSRGYYLLRFDFVWVWLIWFCFVLFVVFFREKFFVYVVVDFIFSKVLWFY